MLPRPTNTIEELTYVLRRWTELAFPVRQAHDVELLHEMWMRLADAITFPDGRRKEIFYSELRKSRGTPGDGDPPVQALEQRIRELVAAGIRTRFLVIAMREALDELIGRYFPATLYQWQEIADSLLPLSSRLSHTDEESQPSSRVYGP